MSKEKKADVEVSIHRSTKKNAINVCKLDITETYSPNLELLPSASGAPPSTSTSFPTEEIVINAGNVDIELTAFDDEDGRR